MQFEWDENKRKTNIEKHGIDFADAVKIFDGFVSSKQDTRTDYGEERYITIGLLNGLEVAVINTPREENLRIISVRRARDAERKKYHEEAEKDGHRLREAENDD